MQQCNNHSLAPCSFDEQSRPLPGAFTGLVREVTNFWDSSANDVYRHSELERVVMVFVGLREKVGKEEGPSHSILVFLLICCSSQMKCGLRARRAQVSSALLA